MSEGSAPGKARQWWVLAGACTGLTVLMLDSTALNVALSEIRRDLDATSTELQWIPNIYLLTIAALVVTAGRVGDILGRRNGFLVGLALFGLGSVIGALAPSPEILIAGRMVMGVGAAFVLPLSLTLVTDAFAEQDRARAMGIWAGVSSLSLALGPIVGGALAEIDWRLIFWINLPIVIFGFLVTRWAAVEARDPDAGKAIDLPGFALLTVGLAAVTLGFAQAESWGWDSPATLGTIAAGLVLLVGFWFVEHRVRNPIVDFELFRNKPYLGASAAAFALVGAYWVVMFFQPQYLQDILGYSAVEAGLLILPVTAPMVVISLFAHRLVDALGPRVVMGGGTLLGFVGLVLMTRIDADTTYSDLVAGYLLFGLALGFVYAPMQTAAMAAMPPAKAGIASGVLAMNRILSGALSLAITASLFHTFLRENIQELVATPPLTEQQAGEIEGLANGTASAQAELARQPADRADEITAAVADAFTFALSDTLWFPAAVCAIGAILTWAWVRAPGAEEPPPHPHRHRRFHI